MRSLILILACFFAAGVWSSAIIAEDDTATAEDTELSLSANVGFLSDYIFRGVHQSDATANGGLDLEYGAVYLGTWIADLDQDNGIEYDLYGGVDVSFADHYHLGAGFTLYRYSGDNFDDNYDEINFYAGAAHNDFSLELEYSTGEHDILDGGANDYDFLAATLDYRGLYLTLGEHGISKDDAAAGEPGGGYIEFGYATELAGFDLSAALIRSDDELIGDGETRAVFGLSYSFYVSAPDN